MRVVPLLDMMLVDNCISSLKKPLGPLSIPPPSFGYEPDVDMAWYLLAKGPQVPLLHPGELEQQRPERILGQYQSSLSGLN